MEQNCTLQLYYYQVNIDHFLNTIVIMDLKAKAPVQNFIDSSSFFGCSFCLQKGISTGGKHHKVIFK